MVKILAENFMEDFQRTVDVWMITFVNSEVPETYLSISRLSQYHDDT